MTAKISPNQVAEAYFRTHYDAKTNRPKIVYYQSNFYFYNEKCYLHISNNDLANNILRFMQIRKELKNLCREGFVKDVIINLRAMSTLKSEQKQPFQIGVEQKKDEIYLMFENKIITISTKNGKMIRTLSHTPEIFATTLFPFYFDINQKCPVFKKLLFEILPDESVRQLIQEWFGYCMIPSYRFHRFLTLQGNGANGKSVILTVLRCLLGDDNISTLSLNSFSRGRRFDLSDTIGKLVNICGDTETPREIDEGLLKTFTSGEPMSFEKKHRDIISSFPTARLIFATNNTIRFNDNSNGISRRQIIVPFTKLFSEKEANPDFVDPHFWQSNGELPGIAHWTLEGLKRLLQRGRFVEPQACQDFKQSCRQELSPIRDFLWEYTEITDIRKGISVKALYQQYREFCHDSGENPKSKKAFTVELKKIYPHINISKNALTSSEGRSRKAFGVTWKKENSIGNSHIEIASVERLQ